jgi:low affinity Fe/Cu permease
VTSQDEAAAMQQTLEETLARFDEVQAQTATVEEEVVDEVRHVCQSVSDANNILILWETTTFA